MEFKDRLKALRQQKGLSQEALAKEIYVSRSAIAKWESGLGIPNDSNIKELCKCFQVEEEWLLDRYDLKKQIGTEKWQDFTIMTAVFGVITPFLYVLLGFVITFKKRINISMYYPPSLSFFDFIISNSDALFYLLWISVSVWAVTVGFAVMSIAISKLRQRARICCCINLGLTLFSLLMFLVLFFVTIQVADPIYTLADYQIL